MQRLSFVCPKGAKEIDHLRAALALAEQEKRGLQAEVERRDAALREWYAAECNFVDQDGSDAAAERLDAAEDGLVAALSPAAPKPSKAEDKCDGCGTTITRLDEFNGDTYRVSAARELLAPSKPDDKP
jgi:hypothetical protein